MNVDHFEQTHSIQEMTIMANTRSLTPSVGDRKDVYVVDHSIYHFGRGLGLLICKDDTRNMSPRELFEWCGCHADIQDEKALEAAPRDVSGGGQIEILISDLICDTSAQLFQRFQTKTGFRDLTLDQFCAFMKINLYSFWDEQVVLQWPMGDRFGYAVFSHRKGGKAVFVHVTRDDHVWGGKHFYCTLKETSQVRDVSPP